LSSSLFACLFYPTLASFISNTTTADSFDWFYGLYKFNQNAMETIIKLQSAMDNVVGHLEEMDNQ
jgi:hypothetical protein